VLKGSLYRGALYSGLLFGAVVAVELPPQIVTPVFRQAGLSQNITLKAYHKLGSTAYDARLAELLAKSATVQGVTGAEFTANFGKLGANTASKIALIPVDSLLKRGRLAAEGYKDISDEELVALLMEILDV
jgi:hypothetical protein